AIGPGFIETPLNEKVRASNPELVKIFMDHTPLGRTGKPEDIVGPAIFLASDLSAYVTGSIVMADGGYRSILRWHRRRASFTWDPRGSARADFLAVCQPPAVPPALRRCSRTGRGRR